MMRITRHQMFLEMARAAAKRSTCFRNNVGAVIIHNNRVISIGYNGSASGEEHCTGNQCPLTKSGGCRKSIHAEVNAIKYVPGELYLAQKWMYCTHSPCETCAPEIIKANITALFYENEYRITAGIDKLLQKISVFRVTPSGYLIDKATGDLVIY